MLSLPKKTLYALEAVVDIAYNARPEPVQAKEITKRQGIPQRYLEQVMQHLVRAGILRGVRGPRGGYRLARERRRITVGEIIRQIAAMDAEEDDRDMAASPLGREVVRPLIDEVQGSALEKLDEITVEDLCQRARQAEIGKASSDQVKAEKAEFDI